MQFIASLHRVAVDREGEVTITLKAPASELANVAALTGKLEEAFTVKIE